MQLIIRPVRRCLGHIWWWIGVAQNNLTVAWLLTLRTIRISFRSALSLRKEFLVLHGDYPAGLFAEFGSVLGMLEHYETWQNHYAGVMVDFKDKGLYYEPALGENWWEYYFEPVNIVRSEKNAVRRVIDTDQHVQFTVRSTNGMTRACGHRLISRYIRVKPHIQRKVDAFVHENFAGASIIGIHYRGTDKSEEAPRVSYETVLAAIHQKVGAIGAEHCRLFLATDEQAFLDCMLDHFANKLIYCKTFRSTDGTPTHGRNAAVHERGEDAVIDCLLLSRCHHLIRTSSNLGLCATFFNPLLPITLLTPR